MEDDDEYDYDLAFELYDRPKAKLVAPNAGFSSRFYSTSTSSTRPQAPVTTTPVRQYAPSAASLAQASPSAPVFRSSFSPPVAPKHAGAAPLNIVQSTPSSVLASNRPFILPTKSTHSRDPHTSVIRLDSASEATKRPPASTHSSLVTRTQDEIGWFEDDDVLAPVPGISKQPKTSPPKKASSRSPVANRRQSASSRNYSSTFASKDEANHTVSIGAMDEIAVHSTEAQSRTFPPECDKATIDTWRYPSNYEKRDYQFAMVESALFRNSLICLPTGLGKTLIAAVVMYNFYRWFPKGKIVFMAPAKPLVAQQIEACRDIVSIPASDSIAMTGKMSPETRAKHWMSKRIFFVTPHIPKNDIINGICPAEEICLLVFDEAHHAHGDYAYCDVIRHVAKATPYFRVLALSATPGSDFASIQEVITNLLISKIELRTEESPDVKPYMHQRFVEEMSVKIEGPILKARELLRSIIKIPVTWLQTQQVLYRTKQGDFFTFNRLEAARNDFRNNPNLQRKDEFFKSNAEARFAAAMALFHGMNLISNYGLGPFKEWLNAQTAKPIMEKTSRFFTEMVQSREWHALSHYVNEELGDPNACRHPKMTKLENVVLDHFHSISAQAQAEKSSLNINGITGSHHSNSNAPNLKLDEHGVPETRVMIFVQFRDTVDDIVAMLKNHEPFVRPMGFVGQSKKGLSQKQQAEVVQKFRAGHFNTLVATSIGEEGLDIGEVDLIVCYDSQKSPIRMIQRLGRTGRKRNGRCVMLLTAGTEDVALKRTKVTGKTMIRTISNSSRFHFYNAAEPNHLLPADHPQPKHVMWHMEPINDLDESEAAKKVKKPRAKKASAKRTGSMTSYEDAMLQEEEDPNDKEDSNNGTDDHLVAKEDGSMTGRNNWNDIEIEQESDSEAISEEIEMMLAGNQPMAPKSPLSSELDQVNDDDDGILRFRPKASSASAAPPATFTSAPPQETFATPKSIENVSKNIDIQPPSSAIMDSNRVTPSQNSKVSRAPSVTRLTRTTTVLDQSQSTLDSSESMQVPLDDFPLGFLEDPRPLPSSDIPPPPSFSSEISVNLDAELGIIPPPPSSSFPVSIPPPPPMALELPGQKLNIAPTSSTPANSMVFHTANSAISSVARSSQVPTSKPAAPSSALPPALIASPAPNNKKSLSVISEDAISSPKKTSATISASDLSNLSSSFFSAEDGSETNSPQFKRLKRVRSEDDEDSDDLVIMSPPVAKRACAKLKVADSRNRKRKSRFLDEEASLDLDNSDGDASMDISGAREDDVPNSQDLAFIASDGESDLSMTGMRAVYAKSLASPDKKGSRVTKRGSGRGVNSLDWLDGGEGLERKMAEWAAYSDVEASSDGNDASAYTVESIADYYSDLSSSIAPPLPRSLSNAASVSTVDQVQLKASQDPVVISSPETSPQARKNVSSKPLTTASSMQPPSGAPTYTKPTPVPLSLGASSSRYTYTNQQNLSINPKIGASVPLGLGKRTASTVPPQLPSAPRISAADVVSLLEGLDSEDLLAVDGDF